MIKKFAKIILGLLLSLIILSAIGYVAAPTTNLPIWGINFSTSRARDLDFEPTELFTTILDDLQVKYVRLPLYWNTFETEKDNYDFTEIRKLLEIAQERNVKVILVLGRKLPRWPECHEPDWFAGLTPEAQDQAVINEILVAVRTLESQPSIFAWQLENEPFFEYGPDCPMIDRALYKKELATIREWDSQKRPIIGTDSGEKGAWLPTAWTGIDIFGSTMYRQVYLDKKQRYTTYPLPAWTYRVKAGWIRMFSNANRTFGVELQAEPWFAGVGAQQTQLQEQLRLMNSEVLNENIAYARASGFEQHYFWGAEWWYWMAKVHHDNSLIETVRPLFK